MDRELHEFFDLKEAVESENTGPDNPTGQQSIRSNSDGFPAFHGKAR
jgi:hypothetical protein